jgi:hypothetical protein
VNHVVAIAAGVTVVVLILGALIDRFWDMLKWWRR